MSVAEHPAVTTSAIVEAVPAPTPAPSAVVARVAPVGPLPAEPQQQAAPQTVSRAAVVSVTSAPATVEPAASPPIVEPKAATGPTSQQVIAATTPVGDEDKPAGTKLIAEGRALFSEGHVLEARKRFMAALPLADAMLALARSFDANYLSDLQTADASADAPRAMSLYSRAATLGSEGAAADLERISASKARPK